MKSLSCILYILWKSVAIVCSCTPRRLSLAIAKQFFPTIATKALPLYSKIWSKKITKKWKKKKKRIIDLGFTTVLSIKMDQKIVQFRVWSKRKKKNLPTLESDLVKRSEFLFAECFFANEERPSFWCLEEHFNCKCWILGDLNREIISFIYLFWYNYFFT